MSTLVQYFTEFSWSIRREHGQYYNIYRMCVWHDTDLLFTGIAHTEHEARQLVGTFIANLIMTTEQPFTG